MSCNLFFMTEPNLNNKEGITFKDLVAQIIKLWTFLFARKFLIVLAGLIGGIWGYINANKIPTTYTAKVTFILEEGKNNSNGLGGLASIAGQFGVDVGGASGGGILSGDNILLYFKSPSLAREVLLTQFDSNKKESIADVYSRVYGLNKGRSRDDFDGAINFKPYSEGVTYTRLQDSMLLIICENIISSQFTVARTDKKASFIDVTTTMRDELLAKIYCERIVQRVVQRYINTKIQRQKATVDKLQHRADSIALLLKQKTISGASLQNSSSTMDINPLFKTGTSVAVETAVRDKTLLSTIFASVTQNLELAKFTLSQETPVIQIIDSPMLPLKKIKQSVFRSAIIYLFIFSFAISVILIFKKILFNALDIKK